jgi:uncharacterized membrane protein
LNVAFEGSDAMHDARAEILQWVNQGVLPQERLRDALRTAGVTPSATQWRVFLERLLTWLGAALIASAALYFVAANWQSIGRYAKFALVEGALVASLAGIAWRGLDSIVGRAALFAAAVLTGVLLALVGQVYQTGADTFELFALWAAAITVWVAIGRQPALWLLWLALVNIAVVLYFRTFAGQALSPLGFLFAPREALWWVFAVDTAALAVWEWLALRSNGWIAVRWAPRVIATIGGALVTLLVLHDIVGFDRESAWSLIPYIAWIGAICWAYRLRIRDVFVLSGMVLSIIVVVAFALGRPILEHGGAFGFLVVGLILIACAAAGSFWLRAVAAEDRGQA